MSARRGLAGGCRAWLAAALLVLTPLTAAASSRTVRSTPLRSGPSWFSSTLDVVANGASLQLLERQDNWVLVRVDGREGWVRLAHVETFERVAPRALPTPEPSRAEEPPRWADVHEPPRWEDIEERSPWWDVEGAQPTAVERAQPTAVERAQPTAIERAQPTAVEWAQPTAVEWAQPTAIETPAATGFPRPPATSSPHSVIAVQRAGLRVVTPMSSPVASWVESDPGRTTPARPILLRVAPSWAAAPAGTVPSGVTISVSEYRGPWCHVVAPDGSAGWAVTEALTAPPLARR